jgi:hypothetical protein
MDAIAKVASVKRRMRRNSRSVGKSFLPPGISAFPAVGATPSTFLSGADDQMHATPSFLAISGIPGISDGGRSGVPEADTLFVELVGNSDSYASFAIDFRAREKRRRRGPTVHDGIRMNDA